jgi:hypothetical protein
MPLRDSLPNELIDHVVELLRMRAGAQDREPLLFAWADKMLDTACRHIEHFVEPEVSVEAAARWKANGGKGDLRAQRYRKPSAWKRGAGLHYEHAVPVPRLRDELVALGANATAASVRVVLETAEIIWMTAEQKKAFAKDIPRGDDWRTVYGDIALTARD